MSEIMNLFCYGSLQLQAVIKAVTGREFEGQRATLQDFAMFRVKAAEYPGIIPKRDCMISGVVYRDLDSSNFRALDAFEGDQYYRQLVDIIREGNQGLKAWVYTIRDDKMDQLTREPWSLSSFIANDYDRFFERFVLSRRELYASNEDD